MQNQGVDTQTIAQRLTQQFEIEVNRPDLEQRRGIFIVGSTRSGKSTLFNLLLNNQYQIQTLNGEHFYSFNNPISSAPHQYESLTQDPIVEYSQDLQAHIVDCGGFQDTRHGREIKNALYVQKYMQLMQKVITIMVYDQSGQNISLAEFQAQFSLVKQFHKVDNQFQNIPLVIVFTKTRPNFRSQLELFRQHFSENINVDTQLRNRFSNVFENELILDFASPNLNNDTTGDFIARLQNTLRRQVNEFIVRHEKQFAAAISDQTKNQLQLNLTALKNRYQSEIQTLINAILISIERNRNLDMVEKMRLLEQIFSFDPRINIVDISNHLQMLRQWAMINRIPIQLQQLELDRINSRELFSTFHNIALYPNEVDTMKFPQTMIDLITNHSFEICRRVQEQAMVDANHADLLSRLYSVYAIKELRDRNFTHITLVSGRRRSGKSTLINIMKFNTLLEVQNPAGPNSIRFDPCNPNLHHFDYQYSHSDSVFEITSSNATIFIEFQEFNPDDQQRKQEEQLKILILLWSINQVGGRQIRYVNVKTQNQVNEMDEIDIYLSLFLQQYKFTVLNMFNRNQSQPLLPNQIIVREFPAQAQIHQIREIPYSQDLLGADLIQIPELENLVGDLMEKAKRKLDLIIHMLKNLIWITFIKNQIRGNNEAILNSVILLCKIKKILNMQNQNENLWSIVDYQINLNRILAELARPENANMDDMYNQYIKFKEEQLKKIVTFLHFSNSIRLIENWGIDIKHLKDDVDQTIKKLNEQLVQRKQEGIIENIKKHFQSQRNMSNEDLTHLRNTVLDTIQSKLFDQLLPPH